jgi:hypothetical protein
MRGAIHPILQYAFTAWCSVKKNTGTTFTFYDRGSIPGNAKICFSFPPYPERLWGPPSLLSNERWGLSLQGVKRPGREADQSLPSSAEVKNACSHTSTPPYVFIS